ncbi:MAG: iron-containing alcohol dehydrogenase [Verrucomicrobiae bacterium]|nr:iron-containing alcohol dehydrogenase [Verrucomicrobiae bacterium]
MAMDPHPVASLAPFDRTPRTRLVFGNGTLSRLGELAAELGARRVLVVTDPGIVAAGHLVRARASLESGGLEVTVYDGVRENPTTMDVARCLAVARGSGVDLLVGLGGGSSMDTAKGTNFLLTNGGEMKDYWGVGKATQPMLPLIAVPTTAGTGSECQSAALIADEATHQKMACLDPKAAARVALLDPELTLSQPPGVTAVTGVDALAHAVETAVTTARNAISVMHSREAFRRLIHALPRVIARPDDLEARGHMLLGAAFAGIAIENSMLGSAHAAANPLTARFQIVHGAAVGLMLPHVVRLNAGVNTAAHRAYADLAHAADLPGVASDPDQAFDAFVERLEAVLDLAAIPASLLEAGADPATVPGLAVEASRQWTARFNPAACDVAEFTALYTAALQPRGSVNSGRSAPAGA